MASGARTSIPVHATTLKLLQGMKTGDQNWDEFLRDLADRELDRMEVELGESARRLYRQGVGKAVGWKDVRNQVGSRRKR